jgi:hypothetical protein
LSAYHLVAVATAGHQAVGSIAEIFADMFHVRSLH